MAHLAHLPLASGYIDQERLANTRNVALRYFTGGRARGAVMLSPTEDVDAYALNAAQAAANITGVLVQYCTANTGWRTARPVR